MRRRTPRRRVPSFSCGSANEEGEEDEEVEQEVLEEGGGGSGGGGVGLAINEGALQGEVK